MMRKDGRQTAQWPWPRRELWPACSEVGGAVDGHRPGGGFRDGGHVEEFVFVQPFAALDELFFQQGDHGVAAAEGEQTDLEKGEKQRPEAFGSCAGVLCFMGRASFLYVTRGKARRQ